MIGTSHHYGVTVSDMDEALEFYRDTLGMEQMDSLSFASEEFSKFVGVEGVDVDLTFLDADGCAVELLEYHEPPGGDANEGVSNNDVGAAHFCLEVDDIDAVYEDLSDEVEFVNPPQTLANGAEVAYMHDPDGNIVELLSE
ncbi:VOC family protein [Haloplanus pelagicus]|jgi:catechol 2,3-dioxygenase-like lactoylglutathione lyase family enzyme|uniref:VOC family protein n=1 Tax=Haloplanus pelagicus TaxID=2949995 RepID=UPI00203BF225|nr:VOC family protein [Haloplanus sp. HW8-1]